MTQNETGHDKHAHVYPIQWKYDSKDYKLNHKTDNNHTVTKLHTTGDHRFTIFSEQSFESKKDSRYIIECNFKIESGRGWNDNILIGVVNECNQITKYHVTDLIYQLSNVIFYGFMASSVKSSFDTRDKYGSYLFGKKWFSQELNSKLYKKLNYNLWLESDIISIRINFRTREIICYQNGKYVGIVCKMKEMNKNIKYYLSVGPCYKGEVIVLPTHFKVIDQCWFEIRQIWIGYYKNENNNKCQFKDVPKDIIKLIISFV